MSGLVIDKGYRPGAIGRIAELHARYYHQHWNFGLFFEARVATDLASFLRRYDVNKDGFWLVLKGDEIHGSIAVDAGEDDSATAHLRWFILSDDCRGTGIGQTLLQTALQWCRDKQYASVYLWTFEGLTAARHLYEKYGFVLTEELLDEQWGTAVTGQKYVLEF